MNRKKFILDTLQELFPSPKIPLDHTSPFTFLIAVLLSAQCTDHRVNLVTPALFKKADTPKKMIKLSIEDIFECIKSLGLAQTKAKHIHALSKILVEKHEGNVPSSFEELEALPGVGHKTASVVMSQVFHAPAFPVDTHIFRLARRWGLSSGKNVVEVENDLKKLFPKKYWNKLHLQMIYFARTYCPARSHDMTHCPICSHCSLSGVTKKNNKIAFGE